MSRETELQEEIERLTKRLEELEKSESETSTTHSTLPSTNASVTVVQANNVKAKPDNYSDGPWNEWISHFKLCAEINEWSDKQRCQQLAVSLRGRAQRIFLSLNEAERSTFATLEKALQSRIQPEQQRKIHRLTFSSRRRGKGENIVDLATSLRQLASLAYNGGDSAFIEEELVDQFVKALDSKELRVGVSQGDPKTLDDAVKLALKLESIHLTEAQQSISKVNMATENLAGKLQDTAEIHMAGSRYNKDDDAPPKWAQRFFEQQTELLGEMKKCLAEKSTASERKKNNLCYSCGKPGHIARDCRLNRNQGNANRAGAYPH